MKHEPSVAPFARQRAVIGERYGRFVTAVFAHPRKAALYLSLALMPGLFLSLQFFTHVRTSLADLLPQNAPSVRALARIHERLGGHAYLAVIVQSADPRANRRFIDELGGSLKAARLPEVQSIQVRVDEERQWFIDHSALLIPKVEFDRLAAALDGVVHALKVKANPLNLDLDDGATTPKGNAWDSLDQELHVTGAAHDRFPNGYFETPNGETVVLLVWLQGSEVELDPAVHLLAAVKGAVAAIRPGYPSNLVVAYNGEVTNVIEEHAAILADLSFSTLLVFALVGLLIVLYFRSMRAVLVVVVSLLPGLIATFAVSRLTVGSLNSNSAFLGSIIAGNGINYPILFLAYYRAQPAGPSRIAGVRAAAAQAWPGTLGAAATASAAYAGLAIATFRGFSEFGWIGGLGMLITWLFTFLAMPIAIALLDPPRQTSASTPLSAWILAFFARPRLPRWVAGAFVFLALLGTAVGVVRASRTGVFETDLLALRNRESLRSGGASWDGRVADVFGVWLSPVVAIAPSAAERLVVKESLERTLTTGTPALAERVETIDDDVPDPAAQEVRLARLREHATALRAIPEADVPAAARPYLRAWFAPENLLPLQPATIPASLRQKFTEIDGRMDRAVLVFPSLKIDYNDTRNLMAFVDRLDATPLPKGTVVGGGFLFMAEILRLVKQESPRVILLVCLLVALALIPVFLRRPLRILTSVATVAAVAISAQAIMLALGVRVNMFNFAAVPITIGVGADYVVNLLAAMDAFGVDARGACARLGGAILLCSLTTIVGYLSLVFAQSGALRTFGWAAVLGELMAVTTVLLVVPVLAVFRRAAPTAEAKLVA